MQDNSVNPPAKSSCPSKPFGHRETEDWEQALPYTGSQTTSADYLGERYLAEGKIVRGISPKLGQYTQIIFPGLGAISGNFLALFNLLLYIQPSNTMNKR